MADKTCPFDDTPITPIQLMCKVHWFRVPKGLRDEIWKQYRHAPGSRAHLEAINSAMNIVRGQRKEAATNDQPG